MIQSLAREVAKSREEAEENRPNRPTAFHRHGSFLGHRLSLEQCAGRWSRSHCRLVRRRDRGLAVRHPETIGDRYGRCAKLGPAGGHVDHHQHVARGHVGLAEATVRLMIAFNPKRNCGSLKAARLLNSCYSDEPNRIGGGSHALSPDLHARSSDLYGASIGAWCSRPRIHDEEWHICRASLSERARPQPIQ
jgi:hypothetical protein